jgi:hypothetical protein
MNSINKIFAGGIVMSGKSTLWRLLDGHSSIVSNCMHSNIGYFILDENCKKFFLRKVSALSKAPYAYVPMCKISYNTGEVALVDIGTFLYGLYSFSSYRGMYSWAKGGSMFVNMKEGLNERFPFVFDIKGFEETLEKVMFSGEKVFTEEEVLDVIYSSYITNLDNTLTTNNLTQKTHFVDTLKNGIASLREVAAKAPGAKIIIMVRDLESLIFANATRIMSYQGEVKINTNAFKKTLLSQLKEEKFFRTFLDDASKLQVSNQNVTLVNFHDLILNTESTMKKLAKFIGIDYEPILAIPSINGNLIKSDEYQIIGKINDDPYNCLNTADIDLLKYVVSGYNRQYSIFKNFLIFLRIINWRYLPIMAKEMGRLLKIIFPNKVYIKIHLFIKRKVMER